MMSILKLCVHIYMAIYKQASYLKNLAKIHPFRHSLLIYRLLVEYIYVYLSELKRARRPAY